MTDEPEVQEINGDENTPATKDDIHALRTAMTGQISSVRTEVDGVDQRLIRVEDDVHTIQERLGRLEDTQADILALVKSINQQLKKQTDVPARVARLEQSVFR